MTVIVGMETPRGGVILGGDACASLGDQVWRYHEPKVFVNGEYVMGVSGSWRMVQLLRYVFVPPSLKDVDDVMALMVTRFIPRLKETMLNHDLKGRKSMESNVLVGVRGHLFEIDGDFHVGRSLDGYGAIGSGGQIAIGALHAVQYERASHYVKIQKALEAAEHHCNNVLGPFQLAEV